MKIYLQIYIFMITVISCLQAAPLEINNHLSFSYEQIKSKYINIK